MAEGVDQAAVEAPHNIDAEETVLGALLLAGGSDHRTTVETVRDVGLQPFHFWRPSNVQLYGLIVQLHDRGEPFDPLTVVARIPGGSGIDPERVHELAVMVPAIGLAPHHARLVIEVFHRRQAWTLARKLEHAAQNGGITSELHAELQQLVDDPHGRTKRLVPLWLDEAIKEELPDTNEYVEGVLETGVLADIVGLPYLHKSAVAMELAVKVAKGRGLLLGRHSINQAATVAYYWSDDSRTQELKRIQDYAAANSLDEYGKRIPVAFYLNPGITLPDDLPTVKQQIREHGFRLVVFDSLYNFADFDFVKDTGAVKHLYSSLKRLCDEIEGLTIVLVDHASKPSDSNKDRDDSISSYGAIWKAAAVRCSLVVTKKGDRLFVSATGNNVKGFPRTPAFFNEARLELTLAEEHEPDPHREETIEEAVLDYVRRNPGKSTNQIRERVKGRAADVASAVRRLEDKNLICDTYGSRSQLPGTGRERLSDTDPDSRSRDLGNKKVKTAWIPLNQATKPVPDTARNNPDEVDPSSTLLSSESRSETSSPYVVGGGSERPGGGRDDTEHDRWLAELAPAADETAA